ncbi:hypothetical protein B0H11DRAFT_1934520 [Mycena galericulata]|nr:hypothetical protein B0H11DRAFT_1934520 [Mycena galericulata]
MARRKSGPRMMHKPAVAKVPADERPAGWLWNLGKLTKMSDAEMEEWSSEGDRVQWFRTEAEMQRWQEQGEQKLAESLRTNRSFRRMVDIWGSLASTNALAGHRAYARQKAAMYQKRAEQVQTLVTAAGFKDLLQENASIVDRPEQCKHAMSKASKKARRKVRKKKLPDGQDQGQNAKSALSDCGPTDYMTLLATTLQLRCLKPWSRDGTRPIFTYADPSRTKRWKALASGSPLYLVGGIGFKTIRFFLRLREDKGVWRTEVERRRPALLAASAFGELASSELELEELSDGSDGGGSWFNLAAPRMALSKKLPAAIRLGVASRGLELDVLAVFLRRIESAMFCSTVRFALLEGFGETFCSGSPDCLSRLSSLSSSAIRSAVAWPGWFTLVFRQGFGDNRLHYRYLYRRFRTWNVDVRHGFSPLFLFNHTVNFSKVLKRFTLWIDK